MFLLNSFGWTGGGGGAPPVTPVTGSGTPTYLPIWTATTVLGDSIVRQNASNTAVLIGTVSVFDNAETKVGIGLSAGMSATLHVRGIGSTSGTSSVYIDNSSNTLLFQIKDDGQVSSTYGYWQGANKILFINPNGTTLNAFGGITTGNITMNGDNNVAFGTNCFYQNTNGSQNVAFGWNTLKSNTSGYVNTAIGASALSNNISGFGNTAIGTEALYDSNGMLNNAIGYYALRNITTGVANIGIGYGAGQFITGGVAVNQTSSNSIYIGYLTKASADGNTNEIIIGYDVIGNGSNTVTLGNTSIVTTVLRGNIGIGITSSLLAKLHIVGAGSTDATKSLVINDSVASPLLHVLDNGFVGFGTTAPKSTIHNAGSVSETKITTVSMGIHTVLAAEYIFNCTGTCTIELPSIAATDIGIGKVYKIFAAEGVTVTVTPNGADTIDGAASATVIGWGMITLRCLSAGNWRVGD